MKYCGTVTQEFINRRDKQVQQDTRDYVTALRQWDFEFPEHHQASIPTSGHTVYEGYEYDTVHDVYGNCDFKHVNKNMGFTISPYILKQIVTKKVNHFVLWKYNPHPHNWKKSLNVGDRVKYEILDIIPAEEIYQAIQEKSDCRGFTIQTY